ncbi:outer membrane protein assembly factor BamB family protein [Halorussus ruber]|uniref:outer membrane protein assembly factor BamB family protein n=1 Tax=Halorussus ruber TaxID=1126238 RepID=UPI00109331A8|nr:PQQ-binding-like beta-propeller repeat protein [Halorussus ruber]
MPSAAFPSRRSFLATLGTGVIAGLAGCTETETVPDEQNWPQFGFDATNAAFNPDATGPDGEPRTAWVHAAGSYYRNSAQPVLGESVYANAGFDGLFALAPDDGSVRWHDPTGYKELTPALADDTLALPRRYGFRGVAADGGLRAFGRTVTYDRWRTDLDYPESPPTVSESVIVAGVGMTGHSPGGGRVTAVELADGSVRWEYPVETSVWGAPAVADGTVYAAARDDDEGDPDTQGTVHAIDLADGSAVWSQSLGESARFNPVDAPVVGDGLVYVPTGTGPLVALETDTGAEAWRVDPPRGVQASPALADGTLYVACLDGTLRALDAATGDTEWTAAGKTYYGGPTVGERGVYAVDIDGALSSWTRSGGERWRVRIDPPVKGSPIPADGRLYVGTSDGLLYALE